MEKSKKIAITGAFGYSGKYVTKMMLQKGLNVKTFTNPHRKLNPFDDKIEKHPLSFHNKELLISNLKGIDIFINTYWVRFNHKKFSHNEAVENTKILIDACKAAGVKKFIHVSITNPNPNSDLEYFKGKGILEEYLLKTFSSYAIIRPAVLFGNEDILINNIAWMIKHLPVASVFGKGNYKLQPIHVEDFAEIIVSQIEENENRIINAIGPETYTYMELTEEIMKGLNIRKRILSVSPGLAYFTGKIIGLMKKDVVITKEEFKGLMQNLLYVDDDPKGKIKLSDWISSNKDSLGKKYANELSRRKH